MTAGDVDLYARGIDTVIASWRVYACGARGAAVIDLAGASAAIFPNGPGRQVYNNAVLERELSPSARADAVAAIEAAYAARRVDRFAVWVHENDDATRAELERREYGLDASTRAMGMELSGFRVAWPEIELGPPDWEESSRILELPSRLLRGGDWSPFHLRLARFDCQNAASAMAFDHEGDCGIYNVGTRTHARRRGLATTLIALHLHEALARGCRTASVQSTAAAESVYAALGFRDLGRILEYVPSR